MTDTLILITDPPVAGSEFDTLTATLDRMRRTFRWKCADLDAAAMGTTIGRSAVTLGGLVRHLTRVEGHSFAWKLHDLDESGREQDWADDWNWTPDADVATTWREWSAAVDRSHRLVAEAFADGGMDQPGREFEGWGAPSLRRIVTDMIDEYARHTGHADLIREAVDGRVGEDAPA